MAGKTQAAPRVRVLLHLEDFLLELHRECSAEQYGLTSAQFSRILIEVGEKYLKEDVTEQEAREFLRGLRLSDLALARACSAGNEKAWTAFLTRFREKLYDAARGIAREESQARELADSLYADLYGMNEREGTRVSKLNFYMGRGSLEGWLRTVLSQEYINRYRSHKRLVSLDEKEEEGPEFPAPTPEPVITADARVNDAVEEALASLPVEDRFILAAYFLDGRKLAEIGRMLGFHEATASRRVDRITKALRKAIRDSLIRRGMSRRQAEEALDVDVRDLHVNVRERLQESRAASFHSGRTPT